MMQESILLCFDIVIVKKFYFHSKEFNENNFLIKIEEVQNFDYCNTPLSILHFGGTLDNDSCNYRITSSILHTTM